MGMGSGSRQCFLSVMLLAAAGCEGSPQDLLANNCTGADLCDDFTSGLDSSMWARTTDWSGATMDANNGVATVRMSAAVDARMVGLRNTCELSGDFDVRVDYELTGWPESGELRVGAFIMTNPTVAEFGALGFVRARHFNAESAALMYFTRAKDGANSDRTDEFIDGVMPLSDLSGTLRIQRIGTEVIGSYLAADDTWTTSDKKPVFGAGNLSLGLLVGSAGTVQMTEGIEATFDNIAISAKSIECR